MILNPNSEIVIASPAILKKKYIELALPSSTVGISGRFLLQKRHESGVILEERAVDNLILNQGLDILASSGGGPGSWMHIGTGTAAPAITQVGLATPAFTSSDPGNTPPADIPPNAGNNWTITQYYRIRFALGVLNGTYTEIGIGRDSTNTGLFSRALISPSITVLPSELLDVLYELRVQPPVTDPAPYAVTITGVGARNITTRPAIMSLPTWRLSSLNNVSGNKGAFTGGVVTRDSFPSGGLGPSTTDTLAGYTNGTYNRSLTQTWSTASGNGAIRSFLVGLGGLHYQHELSATFTKTSAQTLSMTFNFTWTRQ